MAIAQKLAGYSLGKADLLRRAMGKKKKEILDKEFVPFSDGMRGQRLLRRRRSRRCGTSSSRSPTTRSTRRTPPATGWSRTGRRYLKANYPAEYMAALLTSVRDDKDKIGALPGRVPPDGHQGAAARRQRVRRRLHAARHRHPVRPGRDPQRRRATSSSRSSATRAERGPVHRLRRLPRKVEPVVCNKKTVESLIKAGAFDSLGQTRGAVCSPCTPRPSTRSWTSSATRRIGQFDLFGAADDAGRRARPLTVDAADPASGSGTRPSLLTYEREMLGLYVSDHPLFGVEHVLAAAADCSIAALTGSDDRADGATVTIGGLVTGLQRKVTKQGDAWAIATLEDLEGAIEVMFFPPTYQLVAPPAGRGRRRRWSRAGSTGARTCPRSIAHGAVAARPVRGPARAGRDLAAGRPVHPAGRRAAQGGAAHPPGHHRGAPAAAGGGRAPRVLRLDDRLRVTPTPALMGDLKALLGPACLG